MEDYSQSAKLKKAKEKVVALKGFYKHLTVYLVINTMLVMVKLIGNSYFGETFMWPFWHVGTFAVWFFWGIGLFFHGLNVFSTKSILSKNWEEAQIRKFMESDKNDSAKYK